jgi:2-methylisoborneol synthase
MTVTMTPDVVTGAGAARPLGTSAVRMLRPPAPIVPLAAGWAPLPYAERDWGDASHSPLYLPRLARVDDDLGEEVNERLVAWAGETGIHAGRMDKFRDTGFGRLAMLTHPDSDDPDLLLVAAQLNAAWWAADDYYADETPLGATPVELPPRLALVMSAMDPPRGTTPASSSRRCGPTRCWSRCGRPPAT